MSLDNQLLQQNEIMALSQNISNKEALRDKIHEIHNYLRNNGAGYGMNALKVFNIIYGLKKIEENNLLDKIDIQRPECEFSYLLNLANQNKDEELAELIFGKVLDSISIWNTCSNTNFTYIFIIPIFCFAYIYVRHCYICVK